MIPSPDLQVLVVEDEAIVALELEYAVRDAGLSVAGVAGDLGEADAIASKERIDIALVDMNLRDGFSGLKVASMLSERGASVVFLTANPDQAPADFPDALGVYPKPYDLDVVRGLLRFVADRRLNGGHYPPPSRFRPSAWLQSASA